MARLGEYNQLTHRCVEQDCHFCQAQQLLAGWGGIRQYEAMVRTSTAVQVENGAPIAALLDPCGQCRSAATHLLDGARGRGAKKDCRDALRWGQLCCLNPQPLHACMAYSTDVSCLHAPASAHIHTLLRMERHSDAVQHLTALPWLGDSWAHRLAREALDILSTCTSISPTWSVCCSTLSQGHQCSRFTAVRAIGRAQAVTDNGIRTRTRCSA